MERKIFLKVLWLKFLKPLLLLGVLIFSIRFLIRVFIQNGTERIIMLVVLGYIILSILAYFTGLLSKSIRTKIKSRLSEKSLVTLKILIVALLVVLFHLVGFTQTQNDIIKVTDDIELIRISDHAYIHVTYFNTSQYGRVSANGLLFCNEKEAFLFDTPWTNVQTKELLAYIADSLKLELTGFIPNHWHEDCMGGLEFILKQDIPTYANQLTIDIAKEKGLPIPEHAFKDSLDLMLGENHIKCYFLGAAHSLDNIVVWIPSEQILFPACMVKSRNATNLGNTADGDLMAYPKTLSKILQKFPSARIVIPGHGNYGGIELIEHTLELAGN